VQLKQCVRNLLSAIGGYGGNPKKEVVGRQLQVIGEEFADKLSADDFNSVQFA